MITTTSEAVAIGETAIPSPVQDPDAKWFVYRPLQSEFTFLSSVGFVEPAGSNYEVDSKAMRKVGINEDVAIQVEEVNAVGAILSTTGRMLVKLH